METTIKSNSVNTRINSQEKAKTSTNSSWWEMVEFHRFGIMPFILLIIGCIGGFAASFGAGTDIVKLGVIAFPTIIALAFMLAVSPMKVIIWSSSVAVMLDLIILIFQ